MPLTKALPWLTVPAVLLTFAATSRADEQPPLRADVEAAAKVTNIYSLDCSKTRDGKPGYLCWYRADNTNALGAFARIEKGWFGWTMIGDN